MRQRGRRGDLIWKFAKILWWQNFFVHLWQNKTLWVELKTIKRKWAVGGKGVGWVIFMTILLQFHYFTSLETANDRKSEVFLLWISLENVNASADTCWYPQIYNFSSRKELLETLWAYLSRISTTSSTKLLWRTVPLVVSPLCSILVSNT